jgi:hypothetical protein
MEAAEIKAQLISNTALAGGICYLQLLAMDIFVVIIKENKFGSAEKKFHRNYC